MAHSDGKASVTVYLCDDINEDIPPSYLTHYSNHVVVTDKIDNAVGHTVMERILEITGRKKPKKKSPIMPMTPAPRNGF